MRIVFEKQIKSYIIKSKKTYTSYACNQYDGQTTKDSNKYHSLKNN